MGQQRRQFSPEFKADAVALVRSSGRTIAAVAQELGIGESSLSYWLKKDEENRAAADPGRFEAESAEARENAALRRRVAELEVEREILKRATVFWVKAGLPCPHPVPGLPGLRVRLLRLGRAQGRRTIPRRRSQSCHCRAHRAGAPGLPAPVRVAAGDRATGPRRHRGQPQGGGAGDGPPGPDGPVQPPQNPHHPP